MPLKLAKREGQQLLLRFPEKSDLRDRLEVVAKTNGRSLSAEIIQRLEASLADNDPMEMIRKEMEHLSFQMRGLESRIFQLEAKG